MNKLLILIALIFDLLEKFGMLKGNKVFLSRILALVILLLLWFLTKVDFTQHDFNQFFDFAIDFLSEKEQ
ncbi:hypothetical protein [Vibrio parahaemolyticus]|uniref:hypothetical protein n=1 Tax=Vibrio parahaemolyticus TaxID=670 RepID=UPI000B51934C|nr:hypothetical protein [Vibrio parahaemolyticus]EGQ8036364.1 hypothetical protein [Vibrio parahaemolyticus]EGR3072933.1 hypothetical protein [Vibrio parahaemolyticus]EGR3171312.1 hypothetical protein [Vibrio parahaemolyticus]EGR9043533.1 hypothetical protein [Vibrio parahaemolyticus]EHH2497225.1 hypothetical protein [Vibrio parahaemolyticus]